MSNLCPICNEGQLSQQKESRKVIYKTHAGTVDFFYSECDECGAEVADSKTSKLNKRAMIAYQRSIDGLISADEVKALRKKYQITQAQAGLLFGGGEKAFSKYESNDVVPSEAMSTLLRICLRNRACIDEVLAVKKIESDGRMLRLTAEVEKSRKAVLIAKRNLIEHHFLVSYVQLSQFEKLPTSVKKSFFTKTVIDPLTFGDYNRDKLDLQDSPLDWS